MSDARTPTETDDLYAQAGGYMHVFGGEADPEPLVPGHETDCRCHECGREWEKANLRPLDAALRSEAVSEGRRVRDLAPTPEELSREDAALTHGVGGAP